MSPTLRKETDSRLDSLTIPIENLSDEGVRKLARELQAYQVKLESAKDKYAILYNSAPVGYFTTSEDSIILEANLTACRMLGIESGSIIGKPLGEFIVKEDQDVYHLHRRGACKTGEHGTCELRVLREDRTQFYAQMESAVVPETGVHPKQCMTILSDISGCKGTEKKLENLNESLEQHVTERTKELVKSNEELRLECEKRRKIEDTLLQSEKLKAMGVMTAGISHEFNNILAIIKGFTQLIERKYRNHEELSHKLNVVLKSVKDGVNIVRGLREFTNIGRDRSGFLPVDVRVLVDEVIDFSMPRWKTMSLANGIQYHMDRIGRGALGNGEQY
ncbi:MAG: PAS domain S-box protein [Planctomycetes bacterium]|nr:PAS domain S-box protein [Planctomycetota bacterium]